MRDILRSGRFYFWPIIAANLLVVTVAIEGPIVTAATFAAVVSCLASFGFLINDLWDIQIDRVNHAGHFENATAATLRMARGLALLFLCTGLGLAGSLGIPELSCAVAIAVSLVAYTAILRPLLFIPTVVTAVLAVSPLWAPLVLWSTDANFSLWLFVFANLVIVIAREIVMDVRDRTGDRSGGRQTYATVFGARIANNVAWILSLSACILLVGVVGARAYVATNSTNGIIGCALAILISILIVSSLRSTRVGELSENRAIQRFVLRSRLAMCLLPLVAALLWR